MIGWVQAISYMIFHQYFIRAYQTESFTRQAENISGFSEDLNIVPKLIKKTVELFGPWHQTF
jgi:hypothetical protein